MKTMSPFDSLVADLKRATGLDVAIVLNRYGITEESVASFVMELQRVGAIVPPMMGYVLSQVGSWHVSSLRALDYKTQVNYALAKGWVQIRTHYAPAFKTGVNAFELTDEGLEALKRMEPSSYHQAAASRQWYQDNTSTMAPSKEMG